jgi:hypothetical protein
MDLWLWISQSIQVPVHRNEENMDLRWGFLNSIHGCTSQQEREKKIQILVVDFLLDGDFQHTTIARDS